MNLYLNRDILLKTKFNNLKIPILKIYYSKNLVLIFQYKKYIQLY